MLTKRIIPCLDVSEGHVVKGVQFRDLRTVGDPADLAAAYEHDGADEIVFLDISATTEERRILKEIVLRTAERLFIPLTVGGGVRSVRDVRDLLRCGADKISINTAAVQSPKIISEASRDFGSQCIVVAIDSKREEGRHRIYIRGGTQRTEIETLEWAQKVASLGAGEILLTSIDADGTTNGYDLELTEAVASAVPIPVIASGGCGNAEHMVDVLTRGKADAALAASIFHHGTMTVLQVKEHLRQRGVLVR